MKGKAYHGWKVGLPDKFWPVTLDNFFENPDEIRELGLRMMKSDKAVPAIDEGAKWPGYRSEPLYEIDEELTERIIVKILSCYFNLDFEEVFWNTVKMQFHSIPCIDKDKNNIKNKGWVHRDGIDSRMQHHPRKSEYQSELAGLIYLTPDIERDTGTSLFLAKKDKTFEEYSNWSSQRWAIFRGEPIKDEEVQEKWEKHRSCFIEKVRFENIYNRLIMYETSEWHSANSYYTSKDSRLTLSFFIGGIKANKWPLDRIKEMKIC